MKDIDWPETEDEQTRQTKAQNAKDPAPVSEPLPTPESRDPPPGSPGDKTCLV